MSKNKSIGIVILIVITFQTIITQAQVKVGNNPTTLNSSAVLELESTTQGLLLPRMTTTQRNAIANPATGLVIYNTTTSNAEVNIGSSSSPIWQVASLTSGTNGQTLRHDGTKWIANSTLFNNGTNVGLGTTSPLSGLDVQTSLGYRISNINSATTLDQNHNVVVCNNGPYTITLPPVATNRGKVYYIKNINTLGDDILIDGNGSETIDGSSTYLLDNFNQSVRIINNGFQWFVIEESGSQKNTNSFTQINCNGSIFIWNDVINGSTGRVWMDRNLGAIQVATSSTDANSYGDLYQWGRAKDGHQCRNSSTTTTLSRNNSPGHGMFITSTTNWRTSLNEELWNGVGGENNPCPVGYRLPTSAELSTEFGTWATANAAGAFSSILALPRSGYRSGAGTLSSVGSFGYLSSSTIVSGSHQYLGWTATSVALNTLNTSVAFPVRCTRN